MCGEERGSCGHVGREGSVVGVWGGRGSCEHVGREGSAVGVWGGRG